MSIQCTKGIVLKSFPFRNHDFIFTVFTHDQGKLTFLIKGSKKKPVQALCSPLNHVEITYRETKGEMWACEGLTIMHNFANLRTQFSRLDSACDMLHSLYTSQEMGKSAPLLYQLLLSFLNKMTDSSCPETLALSFRLKLLKHEGLLTFPLHCFSCQTNVHTECFYWRAQFFCSQHAPPYAGYFSTSEMDLCRHLTLCRQHSDLINVSLSRQFKDKLERFFKDQIRDG